MVDMAKYEVLTLLWSPSQNCYIQPGEVVELEDDIALLLLEKQAIRPAGSNSVRRRTILKKYEVKHDADNA